MFSSEVYVVAGWFRQFLIMSGEKKNWEIGWAGGVERDNTKAGGRFPRNGKEVVWRASTLEPSHGQTWFLSHESGASLGTCWPSGDGCVQVRGDLGVMISN